MGRPIRYFEGSPFEKPSYGSSPDHGYHLVDFVGESFVLAAAGVPAYQFVKGLRSAPSGGRLAAGARVALTNTPRVVGSFAAFSTVFCAVEIAASLARGKDDDWNTVAAGAAATGLTYIRRGARHAAGSALLGASAIAACLGLLHSLEVLIPSTPRRRTRIIPVPPEPVANEQLKTASWILCHRRPVEAENVNVGCK